MLGFFSIRNKRSQATAAEEQTSEEQKEIEFSGMEAESVPGFLFSVTN